MEEKSEPAATSLAWTTGKRVAVLALIGVVVVAADQASKVWAVETLKPEATPRLYLGGTVMLRYAENPGAFGSILGGQSDVVRWSVLALGCSILLAGVGGYALLSKAIDKPSFLALALILSGGVGNLIDRFTNDTKVIDFLYIQTSVSWLHTNVFNIADVAITAGFIVLIVPMLKDIFIAPKSK